MNELEKAFEEVAKQEDEKLTKMLSSGCQAGEEAASDGADDIWEEETKQEETQQEAYHAEESPNKVSVDAMVKMMDRDWEKQLGELSEYTGKGVYGYNGLKELPNFTEIDRFMRMGASILEAYKMANFDSIIKNEVQKERNKIRGKAHLRASRGGADANEVVVPNDIYRAFKMLEPNMSDEDIRQYYKKTYNN